MAGRCVVMRWSRDVKKRSSSSSSRSSRLSVAACRSLSPSQLSSQYKRPTLGLARYHSDYRTFAPPDTCLPPTLNPPPENYHHRICPPVITVTLNPQLASFTCFIVSYRPTDTLRSLTSAIDDEIYTQKLFARRQSHIT